MNNQDYRMSFTSGGLLLIESIEVARIHIEGLQDGKDWQVTRQRCLEIGITQLPKVSSKLRILREISTRLKTLTETELRFLVETEDSNDKKLVLWIAICRAYRLVREFATEVLQDRFRTYKLELTPFVFESFIEQKAAVSPKLDTVSSSTSRRAQQAVFQIMREAAIVNKDKHIQSALLSTELEILIQSNNPDEFSLFPGR